MAHARKKAKQKTGESVFTGFEMFFKRFHFANSF